ncbi:hypothetical protein ACFPK9_09235 [Rubritalea spongiae]|uniref:Tetratricopeptide repeat protein n=1 Tax=Rubritalea spongiae TaxID=430797 RepID=A0ABW5E5V1_9BACT
MKTITLMVAVLGLPLSSIAEEELSTQERVQKVEEYYRIAEKAYVDGDLVKTQQALQRSLALDPQHGPSYALAIKTRQNRSKFGIQARQKELAKVILAEVDFNELAFEDALRDLNDLIEQTTDGVVTPNLVLIDKNNSIKDKKITLTMKQVPATVVLDYVLNMAGARAKYDQYSITIRPVD